MGFNIKTSYENVIEWAKKDEGTCFYCKADKHINKGFFHGDESKGICDDCAVLFKIGHIGTDRHAIEVLAPEFKSYKEAENWLISHGANLIKKGVENGTHFYHCINDLSSYEEMNRTLDTTGYCAATIEMMGCYNSVEISEDGNIHIIY